MMAMTCTVETRLESWLNKSFSRELTGTYDNMKQEPLRKVLSHLPTPPPPVTFAGTKGKGSTLRLVECGLLAAEQATVAFTSPHIFDIHERWRIGGMPVHPERAWKHACSVIDAEEHCDEQLTYFERCFAIGCLLAAEEQHNKEQAFFLCEVGLGGRLDCANILDCQLAIITHIGYDHTDVLGDTLELIAGEKLAIARPNKPLLIAPQTPEAEHAIRHVLPEKPAAQWVHQPEHPLPCGLTGVHQQESAATALAALYHLVPEHISDVHTGMAAAQLAARCQIITNGKRRILIDGAHHYESIQATLKVAQTELTDGWHCIVALANDKDINRLLPLLSTQTTLVRCGYNWPRARLENDWPETLQDTAWFTNIIEALAALPDDEDLCITGSFYLAGEALQALQVETGIPG